MQVSYLSEEQRPAFILDDVVSAALHDIIAQRPSKAPYFVVKNVKDFTISQSKDIKDTHLEQADKKEL